MKKPRKQALLAFQKTVWTHYLSTGRHDLPWRKTRNPYRILVSEIMLQQTQVDRVRGFYERFLKAFPTPEDVAHASVARLLAVWQGLGYNRRALALQRAAQAIVTDHQGTVPKAYDALLALPGIGPYTAAAVRAFAWNEPGVLLETNVRNVFIHHFFKDAAGVTDNELIPLIEATLDHEKPREWYWALMDYGSHLKTKHGNATRKSSTYAKQSTFKGSDREIRGKILRLLLQGPKTEHELQELTGEKERLARILQALTEEGFLVYARKRYALPS